MSHIRRRRDFRFIASKGRSARRLRGQGAACRTLRSAENASLDCNLKPCDLFSRESGNVRARGLASLTLCLDADCGRAGKLRLPPRKRGKRRGRHFPFAPRRGSGAVQSRQQFYRAFESLGEIVDLFERVVKGHGGPAGRAHAERADKRFRAMVARAYCDSRSVH